MTLTDASLTQELLMRHHQALLAFSVLLLSSSASASGQLDPFFGNNGIIVMHVDRMAPSGDESANAGLVDRQGRYVTFGSATYKPDGYFNTIEEVIGTSALITRHLPDGQLDPTFGVDGTMHLETFGFYLTWRKAVELPDGKLLVAGDRQPGYFPDPLSSLLCRIRENGTLDTTFALNGCRALDFAYPNALDGVLDVEVMDDGRIVVLGNTAIVEGPTSFAVARLTSNGQDDVCFGDATCQTGGWAYGPATLADVAARAMAIDASGAVVVAGQREITNEPNDPQDVVDTQTSVAFRFAPGGSFDSNYGIGGVRRIDYSGAFPNDLISQSVADVVADEDGGVAVVGSVILQKYPEESFVATARLDGSGSLAVDFATNGLGIHRYDDAALRNPAFAASRQSDGKILIAGSAESETMQKPAVLRLLDTGQPDIHFGKAGAVTIPVLADQFWMYPSAVDASRERILLFGGSAMEVQDFNPWLIALDRDGLFEDAFESAD